MPIYAVIIILTPLILSVCCYLLMFSSFNQLVILERCEFREAWENDGCPRTLMAIGPYWPDVATTLCFLGWLFVTPAWAKQHPQALRLLWRYRLATLAWNLGIICGFIAFSFSTR